MTQKVQGSKRGGGMEELCGSRLTPLPCSIIFPPVPSPNPQEGIVLVEQVGFQKRFVKYPQYYVWRTAMQNRG